LACSYKEWNEEEQEENTENDVRTNADADIATSASESVAISSAANQPVVFSASVMNATATVTTSCSLPVSSSLSLPSVQSCMTSMSTELTATSAHQSAPAPSVVVAGVDLTQLPPVQRDLFLRIHQQQQNNAVPESVAPVTTPTITDSCG